MKKKSPIPIPDKRYLATCLLLLSTLSALGQQKPNVVIIYADDLGYGDLSCYGSTIIKTPNIDQVSKSGLRFTNAHSTSPTCTPSRFGLMTGVYPWRQAGTGILPGDAKLIIPQNHMTLPKVFKKAGYFTTNGRKINLSTIRG